MSTTAAPNSYAAKNLNATPISAYLFGLGVDTVGCSCVGSRGRVRLGEGMLFPGRPVTDALERAGAIRRAGRVFIGAGHFCSVFILPWCPARLADVDE